MKKRVLSLFLALTLVMAALAVPANAATTDDDICVRQYVSVETMKYEGEDIKVYSILPQSEVYQNFEMGEVITFTVYRATVENGILHQGEFFESFDNKEYNHDDGYTFWLEHEDEIGSYFLITVSGANSTGRVGARIVSLDDVTVQGGVTQAVTNEECGTIVTMNNCLRKEILNVGNYGDVTVYVVADNASVTVEAMEGRKYMSSEEDYYNWAYGGENAGPAFVYGRDIGYAYSESWGGGRMIGEDIEYGMLTGPKTFIMSPSAEESTIVRELFGVYCTCETNYAKMPSSWKVSTQPLVPTAYASTQTVMVDNKPVEFNAYALKDANGNMTNYVKLRDVASVLNGSAAQFQVGWDGSISITTQQAYTANGSEMVQNFSGDQPYTVNTSPVKVNGQTADMEAITLTDSTGGYTYFKLRDLGKALGFNVSWIDGKIVIDPNSPYSDAN